MGGCQNYDPFLGTLNIRCRIIIGIQKGAIILRTTHIGTRVQGVEGHGRVFSPAIVAAKLLFRELIR